MVEKASDDAVNNAFKVWTSGPSSNTNFLGRTGITLRVGSQVCKTAVLSLYGDQDTGELKRRELRFSTYKRVGGHFNFAGDPDTTWYIVDEEIAALCAFLADDFEQPGRYRVIDMNSPAAEFLKLLEDDGDGELHAVIATLASGTDSKVVADALAQTSAGITSAELAVIAARRDLLAVAAELASQSDTTETMMQNCIGDAWWIFGGRYVGQLPRRDLIQLDEHDLALISGDGSLHIVELKGPVVGSLLKKHRNHWIVGAPVHDATMQAFNYLRSADEQALQLQTNVAEELDIHIKLRRSFATVVVGHRDHVTNSDAPAGALELALRTYNSHLSRVQVVTYDQLLESAERALQFDVV